MIGDDELLHRYVAQGSEEAFAELVQRHVGLVFHAALRQLGGDSHRATDVTQTVFTDVAQKAAALRRHPSLASWLHTSTRFAASKVRRAENVRRKYEKEGEAIQALLRNDSPVLDWERVRPLIDEVVSQLNERDQLAVLLRFFEGRSFAEIGGALRVTEDAARMRVDRALDKLHALLSRRGIKSTSVALGLVLTQQIAAATPAGLASAITSVALAGSTVATTAGGAAGFFSFMSTSKLTIGLLTCVALATATAIYETSAARRAIHAQSVAEQERTTALSQNTELTARLGRAEIQLAQAQERVGALEKEFETARRHSPTAPASAEGGKSKSPWSDPAYTRLEIEQYRASLRLRYGELYRAMNFLPEQIARFEAILAEGQQGVIDVWAAAAAQGLTTLGDSPDSTAVARLTSDPLTAMNRELRTLLGDSGYARYEAYNKTNSARELVAKLAGQTYSSDAPLTSAQGETLIQLIATHTEVIKSPMASDGKKQMYRIAEAPIGRR